MELSWVRWGVVLVSRFTFCTDGATGGCLSRDHRHIYLDQIASLLRVQVWESGRHHPKNLRVFTTRTLTQTVCFFTSTLAYCFPCFRRLLLY